MSSVLGFLFVCCFILFVECRKPVGINAGGLSYWSFPIFSDAVKQGEWLAISPEGSWGTSYNALPSPQFNVDGLPQYLDNGIQLRLIVYGLHSSYYAPDGWPYRCMPLYGRWTVTWTGLADIRSSWCTFITDQANPQSGVLLNGKREYWCENTTTNGLGALTFYNVGSYDNGTSGPGLTELHAWLPDPSDRDSSLIDTLFHPQYIAHLKEKSWGFLRSMDLTETNDNPQQDWVDRRIPTSAVQTGVINDRNPAPNYEWSSGNKSTGVAYELVVSLANAASVPLWINVPALATDDFVENLAKLIIYGSDGTNPYTSHTSSPVWAPLKNTLSVYVEYSNEIWSGGSSFVQGEWAQDQAELYNITKAQFNARRFCEIFSIFQEVFQSASAQSRLVCVAATWTALQWYTDNFLAEMEEYCPTLSPARAPDVLAITTYFGNGIQDWVWDQTYMWNYAMDDPYWSSSTFEDNMVSAFDQWDLRQLSSSTQEGAGPDATSGMAGVVASATASANSFSLGALTVLSYEGGPSIYTTEYDDGSGNNSGITYFMEGMNRHSRFTQSYSIALELAASGGLAIHGAFSDVGSWSKYGQWGHLEQVDQTSENSVKWAFLLDFFDEYVDMGIPGSPSGVGSPSFDVVLPVALWGESYQYLISASGGDAPLTYSVISVYNTDGLSFTALSSGISISGTPTGYGTGIALVRVVDHGNDPAWAGLSFRITGVPGTIFDANFLGTNPGLHLPWNSTYFSNTHVSYSGLSLGAAGSGKQGNDSFVFSLSSSADQLSFADAVSTGAYVSFTVTAGDDDIDLRGGALYFSIVRTQYHAPREYAVMADVTGFSTSASLYDTGYFTDTESRSFTADLPEDNAFLINSGSSIEFRIYGYYGQYSHWTSITELALYAPASIDTTSSTSVNSDDSIHRESLSAHNSPLELMLLCSLLLCYLL